LTYSRWREETDFGAYLQIVLVVSEIKTLTQLRPLLVIQDARREPASWLGNTILPPAQATEV
jgi:hypothetical protein